MTLKSSIGPVRLQIHDDVNGERMWRHDRRMSPTELDTPVLTLATT